MDSIFNISNNENNMNEDTPVSNNEATNTEVQTEAINNEVPPETTNNELQAEPESATIPVDDTNNNLVENEDISALFAHIAAVIADDAANQAAADDEMENMTGQTEEVEEQPSVNPLQVAKKSSPKNKKMSAQKRIQPPRIAAKKSSSKAKKMSVKKRIQPSRKTAKKATKASKKSAKNGPKKNLLRKTKKGKIMKQKKAKKSAKGRK